MGGAAVALAAGCVAPGITISMGRWLAFDRTAAKPVVPDEPPIIAGAGLFQAFEVRTAASPTTTSTVPVGCRRRNQLVRRSLLLKFLQTHTFTPFVLPDRRRCRRHPRSPPACGSSCRYPDVRDAPVEAVIWDYGGVISSPLFRHGRRDG
jgi:hypothetical protein